MSEPTLSAGAALLARLKTVGVDYIFANSGTDFPPIIEGLAEAAAKGIPLPKALTIPHEHAAMGMAHGYYLASGRAQAVLAHTNVGLANCAIGALNAHVEHVPVLLFSGRTPTVEKGRFGARTVPIGWGQEMRDQAALVREASKWDYELRFPEQAPDLVDRAHAIASSSPRGPVYVSLPREVCASPAPPQRWTPRPACARMASMPRRMISPLWPRALPRPKPRSSLHSTAPAVLRGLQPLRALRGIGQSLFANTGPGNWLWPQITRCAQAGNPAPCWPRPI
jgi:acetolactate synthase I/II/III large subunit